MIEPSPFHADTANDINDTRSIVDYLFVFDFHAFFVWKNEKSMTLLRKREKELGQNMIERCLTSSSRVGYLILLENFWSHISRQLTQLEALKLGQLFNGTGLVNLPGSTTTRSRNSLLRYSSFQNASISFAILDRVSMIVGTNFLRKLKEKDKSCISREFFFLTLLFWEGKKFSSLYNVEEFESYPRKVRANPPSPPSFSRPGMG